MGHTGRPKRRGRPSKFSERLALRILDLARQGKTEEQIADLVGISRGTLQNWKGAHPDFLIALKASRRVADELVEAALFERACGYRHPAVKFFYDSESGAIVSQEYTEHYPPDTTACIFWLKNRNRKRWRDRQEKEHSGKVSLEQLVAGDDDGGETDGG